MFTGQDEFEELMQLIKNNWWMWFVALKYPHKCSSRYAGNRSADPEEAFAVWIGEVMHAHGREAVSYVRATEHRDNRDVLFHVLLSAVPKKLTRHWKWRWWELSSGSAWDRIMNDKTPGLFRFFALRLHCKVEFCGRFNVYFEPSCR
jgi:hypothetical protein